MIRAVSILGVILIIVLIYSPLLAFNVSIRPTFLGAPYVLWTTVAATVVLLVVLNVLCFYHLSRTRDGD